MLNSFFDLNFDVLHAATGNRYADGVDIRLVILGPISLYSIFSLTMSSGKHLEDISHDQNVSLKYKLITGAKDTDELPIGSDPDRNKGQRELTTNKKKKGNNHVRIMLEDIFLFCRASGKRYIRLSI